MSRPRTYLPCAGHKAHAWNKGCCCYCGADRERAQINSVVSIETKLRGTSQFDTRWNPPDILAISANWDRVAQAKDFFRLVQSGNCTLEEAEACIRMSEKQRDLLLKRCDVNEARSIQAVFRAREQTWEAFLLLCAGEELEIKDSRCAD